MLVSIHINGRNFSFDPQKPLDISIPLRFDGAQPNAYGVDKATAKACEAGSLVGDTRRGGSCNFEEYKLIPHCNGTHTEGVGHLTHERISVRDCLRDALMPAILVSIAPENAFQTGETYAVRLNETDQMITRRALEKAFDNLKIQMANFASAGLPLALVVRTRPNDESKLSRTYLETIPPFFSTEAIEFMTRIGVRHLLADLPSIDRIYDEGRLSNHRLFWNVEPGSFELKKDSLIDKTVTELIYVPDPIADGFYLLNLQIAPFATDASPSRPLLFPLEEWK